MTKPIDRRAEATATISPQEFAARVERVAQGASWSNLAEREAALFEWSESLRPEDFPAALALLRDVKPDQQARLLEVWAERDLDAAVAWFSGQPADRRPELFRAWADSWARLNADGLREWLTALPEAERGGYKAGNGSDDLARLLAERDSRATFELSHQFPNLLSAWDIIGVWAKRDPMAAAAAAKAQPDGRERRNLLSNVAAAWAVNDPKAALDWADGIDDRTARDMASNSVMFLAGRQDAAEVAEILQGKTDVPNQLWKSLAQANPEAMIAWARKQSDPALRRTIMGQALGSTFPSEFPASEIWPSPDANAPRPDAREVAELWLAESTTGEGALPGGDHVLQVLAKSDGALEAVKFLERMPAMDERAAREAPDKVALEAGWRAVADAALQITDETRRAAWIDRSMEKLLAAGDIPAAQSVIDRLPAGAERDHVLETTAAALLPSDANGAAELLLQLPDGQSRLHSTIADWLAKDRREAAIWIRSTGLLDEEEKSALLGSASPASTR